MNDGLSFPPIPCNQKARGSSADTVSAWSWTSHPPELKKSINIHRLSHLFHEHTKINDFFMEVVTVPLLNEFLKYKTLQITFQTFPEGV